MRTELLAFVFLFPVMALSQNGPECVIKFSGDTLIFDHVNIKTKKSKLVQVMGRTGGTLTDIPVDSVRFIVYDSTTYCWTEFGRVEVLAFSNDCILAQLWDAPKSDYDFYFFDRNFRMLEEMKTQKKCPDQLIKYFGKCEKFKQEVEAARAKLSKPKFPYAVFYGLAYSYNGLCKP
jgi:hypothetical protein